MKSRLPVSTGEILAFATLVPPLESARKGRNNCFPSYLRLVKAGWLARRLL
jgi:hypothetical protein